MWERCLSRGALGSTLPVLYNSGIDITQGPGFVGIRYEMVHDHRIIPLDRRAAAVGSALQFYIGDARGRWEGDTLVVESRQLHRQQAGPRPERRRRARRAPPCGWSSGSPASAPKTIRYVATVNDPRTYVRDWTVAFPLTLQPGYGMARYACHEGNYGLTNALSGSRAAERDGVR